MAEILASDVMPIRPKSAWIQPGGFVAAVLVLVGGTALAHGITALALPVLSRLYAPTDFSQLAVFSSVLSIIATAACLRFDVAVPIPEHDDDAMALLTLAILCAGVVALVLGVAVTIDAGWLAAGLRQPALARYLWLLPIGVFLAGAYSALQHWFVRRKQFRVLAHSRVAQSSLSAGAQIGIGWAGAGPFGLLVGYVMNSGIACVALGWQMRRGGRSARPALPSLARLRKVAVDYHRFPKYSTIEALCNSAAIQVPIILIAAIAAPAEAGYLTMAMYTMQAPMALIGGAIGQVYLSRATEELRARRLGAYTADILAGLMRAGVGPLLAAGILAPELFSIVFGPAWQRAGWLVAWMTPWFVLQFLAAPISMAMHINGRQRAALLLQLFGLVLRVLAVWLASLWKPAAISEAYALSGMVFYLVYVLVILKTSGAPLSAIGTALARSRMQLLCWIVPAVVAAWIVHRLH